MTLSFYLQVEGSESMCRGLKDSKTPCLFVLLWGASVCSDVFTFALCPSRSESYCFLFAYDDGLNVFKYLAAFPPVE